MLKQLGWPTKATPPERNTGKYEKLDMKRGDCLGRGRELEVEYARYKESSEETQYCGHDCC